VAFKVPEGRRAASVARTQNGEEAFQGQKAKAEAPVPQRAFEFVDRRAISRSLLDQRTKSSKGFLEFGVENDRLL
jgi:hypothetical protein